MQSKNFLTNLKRNTSKTLQILLLFPITVCSFASGSLHSILNKDGSRAAATSNMECFVTIIDDWKSLTIITKRSILDVAAALDPPLLKYTDLFHSALFHCVKQSCWVLACNKIIRLLDRDVFRALSNI